MQGAKHEVQRKSIEERKQMDEVSRIRHSCAHVLATAVLRLWPEAKLDIGPPTEEGFYYDFDLEHRFSPEDFEKIEAEMKKVVKENQTFDFSEKTRDEAKQYYQSINQPYKLERIDDIPESEQITFFQNGELSILCRPACAAHGQRQSFQATARGRRLLSRQRKTHSSNVFTVRRLKTKHS